MTWNSNFSIWSSKRWFSLRMVVMDLIYEKTQTSSSTNTHKNSFVHHKSNVQYCKLSKNAVGKKNAVQVAVLERLQHCSTCKMW